MKCRPMFWMHSYDKQPQLLKSVGTCMGEPVPDMFEQEGKWPFTPVVANLLNRGDTSLQMEMNGSQLPGLVNRIPHATKHSIITYRRVVDIVRYFV